MNIVHLSDDLIFASRVTGQARASDLTCCTVRDVTALDAVTLANAPTCAILDLTIAGPRLTEVLAKFDGMPRRPFVVAYGPHVDTESLRAAKDVGCDRVMPRSQFVAVLAEELPHWVNGR